MNALVAAILTATVCGSPSRSYAPEEENRLPDEVVEVLLHADNFELLSISPGFEEQPADMLFHSYPILGRVAIEEDAARERLVRLLMQAMEGDVAPARCFTPRHGIRATSDGQTVDLVICFECTGLRVYLASGESLSLAIGQQPEPEFDKILKDAGIEKAKAPGACILPQCGCRHGA